MKRDKQRQQDYIDTFNGVPGQRVLKDLYLSYGGPTFHSEALEMARREGRREVLLTILRLIGQRDRMFEVEQQEEND